MLTQLPVIPTTSYENNLKYYTGCCSAFPVSSGLSWRRYRSQGAKFVLPQIGFFFSNVSGSRQRSVYPTCHGRHGSVLHCVGVVLFDVWDFGTNLLSAVWRRGRQEEEEEGEKGEVGEGQKGQIWQEDPEILFHRGSCCSLAVASAGELKMDDGFPLFSFFYISHPNPPLWQIHSQHGAHREFCLALGQINFYQTTPN